MNVQSLFDQRFVRHLVRLIRVYWASPAGVTGTLLLLGAIVLEIGGVYGNFLLSVGERRIMDALQAKDGLEFAGSLGFFAAVATGFVLVSAWRVYLRQLVEIRWRESETAEYLRLWMSDRAYYQMHLHRDELDNPDQRIAEDIRDFVASALGLSLSLLSALATLVWFGGLLWALSRDWVFPLNGHTHVPGILLWVALAYAAVSTWLTHRVGRPLVGLNFDRLRYEADFRFALMRFRDNVETVTLSRGEQLERQGATERFRSVMSNWWELILAQRRLTLFTGIVGQANGIVPLLMAAPGFFAGLMTLGTVVQVRFAYGQVSGALIWFVNAYQEIARWRANVERLSSFEEVMEEADADIAHARIHVVAGPAGTLRLSGVSLRDPHGRRLLDDIDVAVQKGDRVVISGPSGTGKTTLLRAIAGVWPYGAGRIDLPDAERMLFVPQRPYLPNGTLRAIVSYPASEGTHDDERIREALHAVGLDALAERLDATESWAQQLSPAEQQRLGIARVLLNEPAWVFLDKATSALDEELEGRLYTLLTERLPRSTLISIAHRGEVVAHHGRRWTIVPLDRGVSQLRPD
ncbi:ABC transporter ATP-binding protein/permease [Candidatus Binatia bacterium]|nr:ABC transporter ATP-binding protein/permease [Candidatus Binatia bacterium]